jgi:hypothetical protein
MITDLKSLLLNLNGLDLAGIEALGMKVYSDIYLTNAYCGTVKAHDGDPVYFHIQVAKRHALHTTVSRYKDTIDPPRVQRIKWVREFIRGNVANSECWIVPDDGYMKRVYCSFGYGYVIWLGQRDCGGWKFESAYPCDTATIRGYLNRHGSKQVCTFQISTCASTASERPS